MRRYLLVGGGPASVAAAIAIRQRDAHGAITLISDEAHPPYFRAGLSEWMHGAIDDHELDLRPAAFYQRLGVRMLRGRAAELDAVGRCVQLEGGQREGFDKLLIATGASPFVPPWPGKELDGVYTYRGRDDCAAIKAAVQARPDLPVVTIGGGILGMEFAYDCKGLGVGCALLVRGGDLGGPIFHPTAGALLAQRLRDDGVDLHLDEEAVRFEGEGGRVVAVHTSKGQRIACSAVVVAVGVAPNSGWLDGSKLDVSRWVQVDSQLRSSHPDIFAAGDVASVWDPILGQRVPTRTWEPSYRGGRAAGANMAGADERYIPCTTMNASLVYDLNYVLLGGFMAQGEGIEVIDAPRSRGRYAHRRLLLKDGKLIGASLLQDRRQFLVLRRLIATQTDLSGQRERLFEDGFDLNRLLPAGALDYYFF